MESYSDRLKRHIHHPKFRLTEVSQIEEGAGIFAESLEFQGQKILISGRVDELGGLKEAGFSCEKVCLLTGLVDAYLTLCLGKNKKFMASLGVREVENYLRDENHIPSILEEDWPKLELDLSQFLIYCLCQSAPGKAEMPINKGWEKMSLVEKIAQVEHLTQYLFMPAIRPDYFLELVAVEEDRVVFANQSGEKGIPAGVLLYLKNCLERDLGAENLNLVAE